MYIKLKLFILFILTVVFVSGCATIAVRESLPVYSLNGVTYYALIPLCQSRGIFLKYDTFSRTVDLVKDSHSIALRVGDNLILVDKRAVLLNHPVDIYQGVVVVPIQFKEQTIDTLFRAVKITSVRKAGSISSVIKKVVIDAGHGGNDPGAIGRTGLREKDVNLDIAKRLAARLRAEGVTVVMTRNLDKFIPLGTRVNITNNSKADLFISIHSNANRTRSLHGFEVYYVSTSVNDSKRAYFAAKNASLNLDSSCFASRSQDLKAILWDMLYTYSRAESIELSRAICSSVDDNLNVRVIGVKDARYEVLRGARIPAVLVEVGFLSNQNEERMLKSSDYREKLSQSIVEGIRDYARNTKLTEVSKR